MQSMRQAITIAIVFLGGFVIMVLEIVGARYLATDFGGAYYVWISQIGVILIALSLGYYIGGVWADRWQRTLFLTWLLIPTAVYVALIPRFSGYILEWIIMRHPLDQPIPVLWQKLDPALGSALIFLWPCFVLAMLSPYMIRVAARQLSHLGRISGAIYAASTVGSIVGVFISGYLLIDLMSLSQIFHMSGVLIGILGGLCLAMDYWFYTPHQENSTCTVP